MENIITLNDDQNRALKKAKEWWLNESDKRPFILEGCAGSGKTTIVKFLVEEINLEDNKICFCTFTGKAASQLQRKGNNASTIHKLIYIPYEDVKTKEIKFRLKNKEEFNYEIELIIVDEYAMVDDKLMTDLESFGVPIILIGDPYQLPPIGTPNKYISLKNNLKDIILTKPMRQALDSPIIYLANKARNKERIDYGEYGNCIVSPRNSIDVEEFMKAVKKELDEFNEHVKEVTTAEIQRLYENGDLQNILQDVSDEYFEALRTELYNIINNIHQSYDRETRSIILFRGI